VNASAAAMIKRDADRTYKWLSMDVFIFDEFGSLTAPKGVSFPAIMSTGCARV
jgi:hypothetical protein